MNLHTALAADLARIAADHNGPGEEVLFTSREGVTAVMRGFFAAPGGDVQPKGATAPVATTIPTLHLPESALAAVLPRPLCQYDAFEIRGRAYLVRRGIPNGAGMLEIPLQEA